MISSHLDESSCDDKDSEKFEESGKYLFSYKFPNFSHFSFTNSRQSSFFALNSYFGGFVVSLRAKGRFLFLFGEDYNIQRKFHI